MTPADKVLDLARAQLGTTEHPPGSNRTKYGAWYGMDGASWCDMFISWLFAAFPGGPEAIGGKFAYTPAHAQWFKDQGRWGTEPRPGAIVFFDFPDAVHRIQHVGIVEKPLPGGQIQTIEGNTSSGDSGSQSNGDGVYRRTRPARYVAGYGYPDWQLMEEEIVDATQEARIITKTRDAVLTALGLDPVNPTIRTGWQEDGTFTSDPSKAIRVTVAKALAGDRGSSLHAAVTADAILAELDQLRQAVAAIAQAVTPAPTQPAG